MSTAKKQYKYDFDNVLTQIKTYSFSDIYKSETHNKLKKQGRIIQGPCPFCKSGHGNLPNSDAAFSIKPHDKGGHCYSCGTSTDIINFLMYYHKFDFKQTIHYFSKEYLFKELTNPYDIKYSSEKKRKDIKISLAKEQSEADRIAYEKKQNDIFNFLLKNILSNQDKTNSINFLKERKIVVPSTFFEHSEKYKDYPEGVVFLDSLKKLINKRYFKKHENLNKMFMFGSGRNAVYDKAFNSKSEDIYITEGVINTLSLYMIKKSSISLFSSNNQIDVYKKFKKYFTNKNAIICFDTDKNGAGQRAAVKLFNIISENFETKSISILTQPPGIDLNDLLISDKLQGHINNKINYAYPTSSEIKEIIKEIETNYNYIPQFKENNYEVRPKTDKEENGTQKFIPQKLTTEIIDKFKGSEKLDSKTFSYFHIEYLESYEVFSENKAHIHYSTINNPIFLIRESGTNIVWRPFFKKPYQEFILFTKKDFNKPEILGDTQLESEIIAATQVDDEEDNKNKSATVLFNEICVTYNLIDLLNLKAIGKIGIFLLNKFLPTKTYKELKEVTYNVILIPSINDMSKAKEAALFHFDIKIFRFPNNNYNITELLSKEKNINIYLMTSFSYKFYYYKKKELKINIIALNSYLNAVNYFKIKNIQSKTGFQFCKINNRIIETKKYEKNFAGIVKDTLNEFLLNKGIYEELRNEIIFNSDIKSKNLQFIKEIEPDTINCGINYQNWFFNDGKMWVATKKGIKSYDQKRIKKYIYEDNVLNIPSKLKKAPFEIFYQEKFQKELNKLNTLKINTEDYKKQKDIVNSYLDVDKYDIKINDKDNYFLQFLWLISYLYWDEMESQGYYIEKSDFWDKLYFDPENTKKPYLDTNKINKMKLHLINKITGLGYLADGHKKASDDFAVILLDAIDTDKTTLSTEAAGGGKSLIARSIKIIKKTLIIPAGEQNYTKDQFKYSKWDGHEIIVHDDMHEYSRITDLVNDISGDIKVEAKFQQHINLNEDIINSPKVLITRNHIDDEGQKVDRRLFRLYISNFFHNNNNNKYAEHRTPLTFFKRLLPDKEVLDTDNPNDLSDLINFFAYAYVTCKNYGVINSPVNDLIIVRTINNIGKPLMSFLDIYFNNIENYGLIDKEWLYLKFMKEHKHAFSNKHKKYTYASLNEFEKLTESYCGLKNLIYSKKTKEGKRLQKRSLQRINERGYGKNCDHIYISDVEQGETRDNNETENNATIIHNNDDGFIPEPIPEEELSF